MEKILIIGSNGQVGSALLPALQEVYGVANVIGSDLQPPVIQNGIFIQLDATDRKSIFDLVQDYKITQIYHLAAILSAKGESNPECAWNINMQTLLNALETARAFNLNKVFLPSSIAVFGANTPKFNTPQRAHLEPATIYGISKVAMENLGYYYNKRFGLDIRALRYPGIISHQSLSGGGTTDYAVDMYMKAVAGSPYECYLRDDTTLPMIYIDDAVRATLELMEATEEKISIRSAYNLTGESFSPYNLMIELRKHIPPFFASFEPDARQEIADSWPMSIDDSMARTDWGWLPEYDLEKMTIKMIAQLRKTKGQ